MNWLVMVLLMIMSIMMLIMYSLLVMASEADDEAERIRKMEINKGRGCPHRYWTLVPKGDDDTDKECFCAIDGEVCYGNEVCKKKEKDDERLNQEV